MTVYNAKQDLAHKIVAGVLYEAPDRDDHFAIVLAIVQALEDAGLLDTKESK